jgi:hypothetical protein
MNGGTIPSRRSGLTTSLVRQMCRNCSISMGLEIRASSLLSVIACAHSTTEDMSEHEG